MTLQVGPWQHLGFLTLFSPWEMKVLNLLGVVVHIFSPGTQRKRQEDLFEFKVSLVYTIISITQKDPPPKKACYTWIIKSNFLSYIYFYCARQSSHRLRGHRGNNSIFVFFCKFFCIQNSWKFKASHVCKMRKDYFFKKTNLIIKENAKSHKTLALQISKT